MLRLLVCLLVLANAAYFAWSHGLLADLGAAPAQQTEPQRLQQQIKPESMKLLATEEARRIENAPPPRPPECLQAGPFDDSQAAILRTELESWPAGSWTIEAGTEPARWIVYMGKYPNADALAKKKTELRAMNVSFESLVNPSMEPGVSLGNFATQAAAQQRLDALSKTGVHTAKVMQERPEQKGQMLRLPAVDESLRPRADELKAALSTRTLTACRT